LAGFGNYFIGAGIVAEMILKTGMIWILPFLDVGIQGKNVTTVVM